VVSVLRGLEPSRRLTARAVVVWLLVAACAAWAAVRLLGLERGYPLVPLVAYTPIAAGATVLVAVVALALRRRWAALVAALLAVALVAAVAPRALGGPTDRRGPELRVLTSNLFRGQASPQALVALVRRTRADVLTLSEITPGAIEALREAGLDELMPQRVVRLGPRHSGTAIFSRLALEERPPLPGTWNPLAAATVRVAGAPGVELLAVHPPAPFDERHVRAWQREYDLLPPASTGPLRVLAGDFNATLDHAPLRDLLATGYVDAAEQVGEGLRATWPVGRRVPPPVTIDHVLADERCGVRAYGVHTVPRSDHKAVFAELVLPRA
jgi:endonuclease/exonuclease/phosphatase (EEP) superfamily protein YafD